MQVFGSVAQRRSWLTIADAFTSIWRGRSSDGFRGKTEQLRIPQASSVATSARTNSTSFNEPTGGCHRKWHHKGHEFQANETQAARARWNGIDQPVAALEIGFVDTAPLRCAHQSAAELRALRNSSADRGSIGRHDRIRTTFPARRALLQADEPTDSMTSSVEVSLTAVCPYVQASRSSASK